MSEISNNVNRMYTIRSLQIFMDLHVHGSVKYFVDSNRYSY